MSSKSAYYENRLLLLVFNAVAMDGVAENDTSSPVTHLVVAAHTADPGEGGSQATSEIVYTGYERVLVERTALGWTVSGSNAWPVDPIEFPEMTGGPGGTITHASIGDGISDHILYRGPVNSNIDVIEGVVPRLRTAVGPTATKVTES